MWYKYADKAQKAVDRLDGIASSSTIMFVSSVDNVNYENNEFKTKIASENLDKGKSILGALLKVERKEMRNPRIKKVNKKKP